jgi:hypothetical protein
MAWDSRTKYSTARGQYQSRPGTNKRPQYIQGERGITIRGEAPMPTPPVDDTEAAFQVDDEVQIQWDLDWEGSMRITGIPTPLMKSLSTESWLATPTYTPRPTYSPGPIMMPTPFPSSYGTVDRESVPGREVLWRAWNEAPATIPGPTPMPMPVRMYWISRPTLNQLMTLLDGLQYATAHQSPALSRQVIRVRGAMESCMYTSAMIDQVIWASQEGAT